MKGAVSGGRGRAADSGLDDSQDDDARAQREAEQAEAERRERRKVLVLNRLGEAAAAVRREYVTKLLARPHRRGPQRSLRDA
jgi:ParB family chromosome partitioning protein